MVVNTFVKTTLVDTVVRVSVDISFRAMANPVQVTVFFHCNVETAVLSHMDVCADRSQQMP